ncbi:MAG: cell filamentation protein Fic [Sphingomonas sp. SCN 67-18]|nr:mobile mystery protein B [Sphingomonas sp. SCN 67-18]ODU20405.1 MAG: cell filamentation protein Fic [Sphingomonas sp. SCN 67-18]
MTDLFVEPDDATPLEPGEREGLLQSWITTRADLNEAEQANIDAGVGWAFGRRADILTERFVRELHKRMLGDVWSWAGAFRRTERNIGIDAYRIQTELHALLADVNYWVQNKTYPADEIAIRFHHCLVAIHPFPNGNGRHARLMADLLIERLEGQPFTWAGGNLGDIGAMRRAYVDALRAADAHDIAPLLAFARS